MKSIKTALGWRGLSLHGALLFAPLLWPLGLPALVACLWPPRGEAQAHERGGAVGNYAQSLLLGTLLYGLACWIFPERYPPLGFLGYLILSLGLYLLPLVATLHAHRGGADSPHRMQRYLAPLSLLVLAAVTRMALGGNLSLLLWLPLALLPAVVLLMKRLGFGIASLSVMVVYTLGLLLTLSFVAHIVDQHFIQHESPARPLNHYTINGRPYWNDSLSTRYVGGYLRDRNINREELRAAWAARTGRPLEGQSVGGKALEDILIDYLTSSGHRKDSVGVSLLQDADIARIQQGESNALLVGKGSIYREVYGWMGRAEQELQAGITPGEASILTLLLQSLGQGGAHRGGWLQGLRGDEVGISGCTGLARRIPPLLLLGIRAGWLWALLIVMAMGALALLRARVTLGKEPSIEQPYSPQGHLPGLLYLLLLCSILSTALSTLGGALTGVVLLLMSLQRSYASPPRWTEGE